ncbi:MAG: hypothetical protein AAB767_00665 [Patescibacteria group bacterium]
MNYETRALRLFCHCEPPLAASEAWREAIQKQPELTAWIASGSALRVTESGVS